MVISYAQQFEDIILWRALKHVQEGVYIDIGASDPVNDSVSLLFHEQGWRGIHVEPSPRLAAALREKRSGDIVIEAAVTDESSSAVVFFECLDSDGIGSINTEHVQRISKAGFRTTSYQVPAITLDDVFAQTDKKTVHWLKIDAENSERQIIEGWRTEIFPWIVVVESVEVLSRAPNYAPWEPLLLKKGYRFAWTDQVNRFYVHEKHLDLAQSFQIGLSVFDEFVISPESHFCRTSTSIARQERDQAVALHKQAVEQLHGIAGHLSEAATRQEGIVRQYSEMAEQYSTLVSQHASLLAQHSDLESGFHGVVSERNVARHQAAELEARRVELSERCATLETVVDQAKLRCGELEHRNNELLVREGELTEAIKGLKAKFEREKSQHETSKQWIAEITEQRNKLAAQNEERKAKAAEAAGQYNAIIEQNNELRQRNSEIADTLAQQASELESVRARNRTLSDRLGDLERIRTTLLVENGVLNAKTAELSGEIAGRDQRIAALLGSRSWRVTKPLRLFMDGVRRCGRGAAAVCGIREAARPKQRATPRFKLQAIATKDFVKKHFPGLFQAMKRNSLVMKLYRGRTVNPALDDWRNRTIAKPIVGHVPPTAAAVANSALTSQASASSYGGRCGTVPQTRRDRVEQAGEQWIIGARIDVTAEKTTGAFRPPASRRSAHHFTRPEKLTRIVAKWNGRTRIHDKQ